MIAVGKYYGLCIGFEIAPIAARCPVEGWFKHDLFGGIALRFVKICCRFGKAEDIAYAVVTHTVPGAEICMGIVIEGAPADTAGVLGIGTKLVVNARMT